MNDLERLKEMFGRANIQYTETDLNLVVERGYSGFCTEFEFDANGMLVDMGAYE